MYGIEIEKSRYAYPKRRIILIPAGLLNGINIDAPVESLSGYVGFDPELEGTGNFTEVTTTFVHRVRSLRLSKEDERLIRDSLSKLKTQIERFRLPNTLGDISTYLNGGNYPNFLNTLELSPIEQRVIKAVFSIS